MTYTFWHAGKLLGHASLSRNPSHPAHRAGILAPTPYGLSLLPQLTRFLTVTLATKRLLESQNTSIDNLRPHELNTRLAGTDVERAMQELGSLLIDMEVLGPDNAPRAVSMLSFSDVDEIRRLGREVGTHVDERLSVIPPGEKYYVVSLSFRSDVPSGTRKSRRPH